MHDNPVFFWIRIICLTVFFIWSLVQAWHFFRDSDDEYYKLGGIGKDLENMDKESEELRKSAINSAKIELSICKWFDNLLKQKGVVVSDSDSEYVGTFHDAQYKDGKYMVGYVYFPPYRDIGKPTVSIMIRRYVYFFGSKYSDKKIEKADPLLSLIQSLQSILENKFNIDVDYDC